MDSAWGVVVAWQPTLRRPLSTSPASGLVSRGHSTVTRCGSRGCTSVADCTARRGASRDRRDRRARAGGDRRGEGAEQVIAALYVQTGGCYYAPDLAGRVDPWDVHRDARKYDGPWPVVAHPPCARWSMLAGLVESRYGYKRGDDDGCFASALASVRRFGGVLEHPAWSQAWLAYGIPHPVDIGWHRDLNGGWCCRVEQRWFGHRARKATWLYAVNVELPDLPWGAGPAPTAWCAPGGGIGRRGDGSTFRSGVEIMGKRERLHTPPAFRDLLISIAESARAQVAA